MFALTKIKREVALSANVSCFSFYSPNQINGFQQAASDKLLSYWLLIYAGHLSICRYTRNALYTFNY